MFAYDDYHRLRSAELRRTAERDRLVREAVRTARETRRAGGRGAGARQDGTEAESHTGGPGRSGGPERRRFTRAA
ncbi:hypothetical protein [Streptomyces sp. NPDC059597]|uniref:hypothetical protein n=1 Tax=Streptomyces sp. NPDC059597 TaxID=3346879 RepID=UPI0036C0FE75